MKIAALVLAAGLSRRYGKENKLLETIGGELMVVQVVRAICRSSVDQVLVLTGHESSLIEEALAEFSSIKLLYNPNYQLGMSTSIVAGVQNLQGMDACMICLADLPYLKTEDYSYFVTRYRQAHRVDQIQVPSYRGRSGHPVIFGSNFFDDLTTLPISDFGARDIIRHNLPSVRSIEVDHERILQDIDIPKYYK
jgi:molybdenum cofactor cytidylyltransferase